MKERAQLYHLEVPVADGRRKGGKVGSSPKTAKKKCLCCGKPTSFD